ncbi:HNH endonuclease signature motif containing protein [Kitasatospora camelliae]|uniref:HNH endonuclease signature motif containing protein n=1 Tax=Kitasatospora camelliae TaxID=3156397 RepID=A0AAU8K6A1_9ACTN
MAGIKRSETAASSRPCAIEGCSNLVGRKGAGGLCSKHYQRKLATGSATGTRRPSAEARFFEKVREDNGCWTWTGAVDRSGYGLLSNSAGLDRKRMVKAHRWCYEFLRAEIPPRLELDHLCRNRACVNPWHLEPVTSRVNTLRGRSFSAANARKSACHRGHPFTPANTYVNPAGSRICRACSAASRTAYEQRKSLKKAA